MNIGRPPKDARFSNKMKLFFKEHQDVILIFFALFLFGVIAAFYLWGMEKLVVNLNAAMNPDKKASAEQSQFYIEAAKEILKKRGFIK